MLTNSNTEDEITKPGHPHDETQTLAVIPPSTDIEPIITIEGRAALSPEASFVILFEPTADRVPFAPSRITVIAEGQGDVSDAGIFGVYIDRIPSIVGYDPVPIEAFRPKSDQPMQALGIITPFSLVEITGRNFGQASGMVIVRLEGSRADITHMKSARDSLAGPWHYATHVRALQRTIDSIEPPIAPSQL